jgi:hypothetical protein
MSLVEMNMSLMFISSCLLTISIHGVRFLSTLEAVTTVTSFIELRSVRMLLTLLRAWIGQSVITTLHSYLVFPMDGRHYNIM